jgi:hypothetical protein
MHLREPQALFYIRTKCHFSLKYIIHTNGFLNDFFYNILGKLPQ